MSTVPTQFFVRLLPLLFVLLLAACGGGSGGNSSNNNNNGDTTPPVLTNGAPAVTLSSGMTDTVLSLNTDENANCRFDTTNGVAYSAMANSFTTSAGTTHSSMISGLLDGQTYNYYVRCQDTSGNADTSDYLITFTVARVGNTYYVATGGNDADQGTIAQPWLTLSYALATSLGGDTIYVRGGTYTGDGYRDLMPKSGTVGSYTTIQGYPGDTMPVIDAGGVAGSQTTVFTLANVSYVRLKGLHMRGGGGAEGGTILIGGDAGLALQIIIEDCKISDTNVGGTLSAYNPAHVRISYGGPASDVIIQNCEVYGTYASGVKVDGRSVQNITIKNNHIHNTLHGIAVKWGVATDKNILLTNNNIHDIQYRAFYIDQGYVRIEQNLVYNISGAALFANDNFNGNNLQILHNTFHNCGLGGGAANAIYLQGSTAVNATIMDNIISDCGQTFTSIAIFPYGNATHNTTIDYNNVFDTTTDRVYREYGTTYTYSEWKSYYPTDANSVQADPLFVNVNAGDFRLQPTSPGKNAASDGTDMGANICAVGVDAAC